MNTPSARPEEDAQFLRQLEKLGRYETPSPGFRGCGLLQRSDIYFYLRQFLIVCVGGLIARRGRFDGTAWTTRALKMMRVIEKAGGHIRIEGAHHMIGLRTPTVFVANHMSIVETLLLPGGLIQPFHPVTVVLKESLLRYPAFGAILRAIGPIAVSRRNAREDLRHVLEEGVQRLQQGQSVLVFPQSTRQATFRPAAFNSLGAKLAHRAGVPVLPVAVRTDFQQVGRRVRDLGPIDRTKPIHIAFSEALPSTDPKQAHRQTVERIAARMREWGVAIEESPA